MPDKLPPKVLVAEHDEILNANLCNTIERYWFDVIRVRNANEVLKSASVKSLNIVVISSRIQDMAPVELGARLRRLPKHKDLPIIFLIDPEESESNYSNIDQEFTEILKRPYTSDDLMKVIRSLLRKSKPIFQDKVIRFNDISMDLSTFKVFRRGKDIHLGPTEFKILQLFVQKPDTIFSRKQIIDYVWGSGKDIAPRTIDVHINRIRTLMKLETDHYQIIKTIRASGYSLK